MVFEVLIIIYIEFKCITFRVERNKSIKCRLHKLLKYNIQGTQAFKI